MQRPVGAEPMRSQAGKACRFEEPPDTQRRHSRLVQRTSKTWQVNTGWGIAANIAVDLAAWTRLLGYCDDPDLRDAGPDTLRYRIWHIPARPARQLIRHHNRNRAATQSVSGLQAPEPLRLEPRGRD